MRTAIFTYADGPYVKLAERLIISLRRHNVQNDFISFGDRKPDGATQFIPWQANQQSKASWMFKIDVTRELSKFPYDRFVWMDADNYAVHHFDLEPLFDQFPAMWSLLESDCTGPLCQRGDWWWIPLGEYIKISQQQTGRADAYGVNGGLFGLHGNMIQTFTAEMYRIYDMFYSRGFTKIADEVPLSIVTQIFNPQKLPLLADHLDLWASDWMSRNGYGRANFTDTLPTGQPWGYMDYQTGQRQIVNPALVHAMRSKNAVERGQ